MIRAQKLRETDSTALVLQCPVPAGQLPRSAVDPTTASSMLSKLMSNPSPALKSKEVWPELSDELARGTRRSR